tara:strand:+ start:195 stop:506 length:312 start_codon:yes stop_codon:yes gene_type:complete
MPSLGLVDESLKKSVVMETPLNLSKSRPSETSFAVSTSRSPKKWNWGSFFLNGSILVGVMYIVSILYDVYVNKQERIKNSVKEKPFLAVPVNDSIYSPMYASI